VRAKEQNREDKEQEREGQEGHNHADEVSHITFGGRRSVRKGFATRNNEKE
jgi:hypothetical protein